VHSSLRSIFPWTFINSHVEFDVRDTTCRVAEVLAIKLKCDIDDNVVETVLKAVGSC
jgi:hypothetical protein